jgi:transposase InsO family protein
MIRDLMTEALYKRFQGKTRVPRALQWLIDSGTCYVARDTVEFRRRLGFEICTTAPYSPESNVIAEALVETFKRDYAYLSVFCVNCHYGLKITTKTLTQGSEDDIAARISSNYIS